MKERFIPPLIMLCAGAITCIIDIYNKVEVVASLKRLFFVLIIFYIIGRIARMIILKVYGMKPKEDSIEVEDMTFTQDENKTLDEVKNK